MPFDGNGQPDFLSIINSEAEKVEPVNKVPPNLSAVQASALELSESLPTHPVPPKETSHLKASTFAEPVLPIDWFSEPVQEYIRTVSESYGCPGVCGGQQSLHCWPRGREKGAARHQPLYELPMRLFLHGW